MRTVLRMTSIGSFFLALALAVPGWGQNEPGPVQGNAGQTAPPGGVTSGSGNSPAGASSTPAGNIAPSAPAPEAGGKSATDRNTAKPATNASDDNPYNPYLEPPPLPKGKPTLIGGNATSVDKVRNRLTIQPFGKGTKVKVMLDERSHIYRNGTETTILGIHKGDHVYADTMLDGSKIFAKNVRVVTDSAPAEVRGQVTGTDTRAGTISVKDELSSHAVTFSVNNATKYSSMRGEASASDVRPGSLIDVQFSLDRTSHDVAQEITILATPGENYIFSGTVTSLDMRSGTLALDNRSDDQNYEVHFDPAALAEKRDLKVGAEVTARAVFDGKQYKADSVRVNETGDNKQPSQSKAE